MGTLAIVGGFLILVGIFLASKPGFLGELAMVCVGIGFLLMIFGFIYSIEPKGTDSKVVAESTTAGATDLFNDAVANVEVVPNEVEVVDLPNVKQEDIELLARLITAEQGYSNNYEDEEEYEERAYLTGSVVINRINSDKFPNSLQEVIYQPNQYACVTDGHINREYDSIAYEIAEELLVYGTTIDEGCVFQAEFLQGSGVYRQIGNTYFCYE